MQTRLGSLLVVCGTYGVALVAAWATLRIVWPMHPLWAALCADVAATVAVFTGSLWFRNSSLYDPYWSVVPAPLVLWWCLMPEARLGVDVRKALVIALLAVWGARLTWNWWRGWPGLEHEDWRYRQLQRQTGRAYWLVSFLGIHLMPTLLVFGGCLGAFAAVVGRRPLGWVDVVAVVVMVGAIALEAVADQQLRAFVLRRQGKELLTTGVWGWSRHPNYLGELGVWWGVWLFGISAAGAWWTVIGPVAMTGLFLGVSLPLMERKMAGRPGWEEYRRRVPRLVPRPW